MAVFPARLDRTLISNFIKGYWENSQNHRFALQALMKRGNITTGSSGSQLVWDVRGGRYSSAAYNLLEGVDVSMKNHYFQCNVPWAFLQVNDGITRDEMAMASGEWAMVRHEKEMLKNICKDFETRINSDFLNNNGASLTGNVLYGLPTIFQDSGSYSAGSRTATAQGTYAGQSIATSGIAVDGVEPNAWTPTLTNYTSTLFNGGSAATWANNALRVITWTKDQITYGSAPEDCPDLLVVDRTMFSDVKYLITSQQRMVVNVGPSAGQSMGLGIPGAVEHDGLEIVFDNDQPASTGYMLNFHQIYLELLPALTAANVGPKLAGAASKPEYFEVLTEDDVRSNGIIVRTNLRGQFRFSPKHQAKLKNYA
jgi:hypothetical protein